MKRIFLITFIVLLIFAIIFGSCAEPAEPTTPTEPTEPEVKTIEWSFAGFAPPVARSIVEIATWGEDIEEATGGRWKLTIYAAESLVKQAGLFDAAASGLCDVAQVIVTANPERFPFNQFQNVLLVFEDTPEMGYTFVSLHDKYKELRDELLPTKMIFFLGIGGRNLISKDRPIQSLEDFKGVKMSSTSKWEIEGWGKLGAVMVQLTVGEIYQAMETGIIEAYPTDWNRVNLWKLHEVTKYRTDNINFNMGGFPTVMNIDAYNELPEDIKRIFDEETDPMERTIRASENWESDNAESILKIKEFDKEVGNPEWYWLPDDERERWLEVVWPINELIAAEMTKKGLPGDTILEDVTAFAKEYREQK